MVAPCRHVGRPGAPAHDVVEVLVDRRLPSARLIGVRQITGHEDERRVVGGDVVQRGCHLAVVDGVAEVADRVEAEVARRWRMERPVRTAADGVVISSTW